MSPLCSNLLGINTLFSKVAVLSAATESAIASLVVPVHSVNNPALSVLNVALPVWFPLFLTCKNNPAVLFLNFLY